MYNKNAMNHNEQTCDISCNKINEKKSIFRVIKTMREKKVESHILPLSLDS